MMRSAHIHAASALRGATITTPGIWSTMGVSRPVTTSGVAGFASGSDWAGVTLNGTACGQTRVGTAAVPKYDGIASVLTGAGTAASTVAGTAAGTVASTVAGTAAGTAAVSRCARSPAGFVQAGSWLRGASAGFSGASRGWSQTPTGFRSMATSVLDDDRLMVVALPKLSHQMTGGSLVKWLKKKGDPVALYDIICEVETDELVEEVFKVGDFAGNVTLLVESQEEGILADILVPEGPAKLHVGIPIAVFVEGVEEKDAASDPLVQAVANGEYKCPTTDVYDEEQPQVAILPWQSFLKAQSRTVKCMG